MHGGCHVGKPLFFVMEHAPYGNFIDFFERSEDNKRQMWRLFYEAAQGLLHLHTQTPPIVHGDIKCNNMLVGPGQVAKLCDFGYAFIRTLSVGKSVKELPSTIRWEAPECLLGQGPEANPSPESDTYSFGMSIIEAMTGEVPYGMDDDDEIINQVAGGEGCPRPAAGFTDKQWELVQKMTAHDVEDRMSLEDAIKVLKELADEEKHENESNYTKEMLLIQELKTSLEKEEKNTGALKQLQRRKEKLEASRRREEDARSKIEQLGILLQREIASRAEGLQAALRREEVAKIKIKELELILQRERNKYEFEEPKGVVCDQCGDLNPVQSRFCAECGNDIEIFRLNKPNSSTVLFLSRMHFK